jgi:hypothetical protein
MVSVGVIFYCLLKTEHKELEEIFRSKVLAMLKAQEKFRGFLCRGIHRCNHSAYSRQAISDGEVLRVVVKQK